MAQGRKGAAHKVFNAEAQGRKGGLSLGVLNTCRHVKSNPTSATLAQPTGSAFHPYWSNISYTMQAYSTCRAIPSAVHRSCSPRRPCLPCACSQASNHTPRRVATVTLRVRQPLQQSQECGFAPVSHFKALPPIALRILQRNHRLDVFYPRIDGLRLDA